MSRSNVQRLKQSFPDAAATARDVFHRAAAATPRLRAGEWRVLNAVVEKTALWSCQHDVVRLADLAALARLSRRHTTRAIHSLAARELVLYQPGDGRSLSLIGLARGDTLVLPGVTSASSQGGPAGVTPGVTDGGPPRGDRRGSAQVLGDVSLGTSSRGQSSKALSATEAKPTPMPDEVRAKIESALGRRKVKSAAAKPTPKRSQLDKHLEQRATVRGGRK